MGLSASYPFPSYSQILWHFHYHLPFGRAVQSIRQLTEDQYLNSRANIPDSNIRKSHTTRSPLVLYRSVISSIGSPHYARLRLVAILQYTLSSRNMLSELSCQTLEVRPCRSSTQPSLFPFRHALRKSPCRQTRFFGQHSGKGWLGCR